ncbi:MAG TPA: hypothetical protein VFS04_06645 [Alphaproteobacteria bacterium]|nr:hypothetical protein [Alphaproteobacteria bacterium]
MTFIRSLFRLAALAACAGFADSAAAQDVAAFYKGKTVHSLVGLSAGGGNDLQMRLVARHLGKHIPGNPTVVPQNMIGAAGLVMANYLYRAAPQDGTYIGLLSNTLPSRQAVGLDGVQYDASKFGWIGSISNTVEILLLWKTTGVMTIEDAKKKEIIVGGVGTGGIGSSYPRMINEFVGTKFKVIEGYPGSPQLDLAVERGEVFGRAHTWSGVKASKPNWLANKDVNIIAFGGIKPADLNGVPNLEDLIVDPGNRQIVGIVLAGLKLGYPFTATPNVPAPRLAALRAAFQAVLTDPEFLKETEAMKIDLSPVSWQEMTAVVDATLTAPAEVRERAKAFFAE